MTGRILQNGNVIEVRQGDSFSIKLKFHRGNDSIDLTNAKLEMQVRNMEDNMLKFSVLGTPIEAQEGLMAILLTPEETKLDVGEYRTDIQLTTSDGQVNTIFPSDVNKIGIFRVTEQVTNG